MDVLPQLAAWLTAAANLPGRWLLAPIGVLPGWLSATMVSAATGVVLLVVFKYTSHQRAIRRVKADVKAHLLALRLFKESASVAVRAPGRILLGALALLLLAVVPMLVMVVPVSLLLGQLALWYEARPLRVGEEAVVTLQLGGTSASSWPEVRLRPTAALEVATGPVRVLSKREICWAVRARASGYHRIVFDVAGQAVAKELAVGNGFMRVSPRRPGWHAPDILEHPCEEPFGPDAPVAAIEIEYPERASWTSGTRSWLIYWFVGSMVAALCFRRWLNVSI